MNKYIRHRAAGTVACTMYTQGPVSSPPVFQSSSLPVLQFSSPPVFQSSRFPDPVPVGVGVWSRSLETPSGESILRGVQGGPVRAPAWIPTSQEEALAPKFAYLASSWRSCAPSWHQDATTSPKISKKTLSWSQHLPTQLRKPFQDSLQEPPEEAPTPENLNDEANIY